MAQQKKKSVNKPDPEYITLETWFYQKELRDAFRLGYREGWQDALNGRYPKHTEQVDKE